MQSRKARIYLGVVHMKNLNFEDFCLTLYRHVNYENTANYIQKIF